MISNVSIWRKDYSLQRLWARNIPDKRVKPSGSNPITLLERFFEQSVSNKSKLIISKFGIIEGITKLNRTIRAPLYVLRLISGIRNRLTISYILRQLNRFQGTDV